MAHPNWALPALLALLGAACSEQDADPPLVERTDSAGVEIVRNMGADRLLPWRFEPVRSLGGADQGPESFYRLRRSLVDADLRGNLLVLDSENHRVVAFGSDGAHLRTMGGKGGGPGEIEIPMALDVAEDGVVRVFDLAKRALVRWDSAGIILPSEPLSVALMGNFALVDGGIVAPVHGRHSDDGLVRERLLLMQSSDTTELAVVAHAAPKPQDYGCVGLALPPLFSPSLVWGSAGDRIAVAPQVGYEVRIHRPAGVLSVRRDVQPRPVTREMALQEVGEERTIRFGNAAPPCRIPGAEVVEKQGHAPVLPAVGEVALAPDGSIWVRRGSVKGEDPIVDVFDGEGAYLGTLPTGSPYPAAFLPGGSIATIERDEMDIERLVVYRVQRGE